MAEFEKAFFSMGVFAIIVRKNEAGECAVLVNVRTDQERQRGLAGLPADWQGVIVDLPGGGVHTGDVSVEGAVLREVKEETGCEGKILPVPVIGPFALIKIEEKNPMRDIAFAFLVEIEGDPKPSSEATEHRWVTRSDLEAETSVRMPGKLGKAGRSGKMALGGLERVQATATMI